MPSESKQLYSVIILRRLQGGQMMLNYTSEDAALNAFAKVHNKEVDKIFVDSFGSRMKLDPEDIGTVLLVDQARSLEMQAINAEMSNSVNIKLRAQAEKEARMHQSQGGILLPAGPMPPHQ